MSLPYRTLPGDLDHLIADDHAVIECQFQHLEAGRGDRRLLVEQISYELALHADAEERIVFPALGDRAAHALREHHQMKELLTVLHHSEPGEARFEETLIQLMYAVRPHAAEEERELLPELRREVGGVRMAALGREFLAAKRGAPTHIHPHAPTGKLGHRLTDPAAFLLDKVRDLVSGRATDLATDPSGELDPQAQRLIDAFAQLKPLTVEILEPELARLQPTPVDAVRRVLAEDGRPTDPEPVGSVEDIVIPGDIRVRIYRPRHAVAPLPVIVWVHGGGWVLFSVDTYDASCRGLVNKTGAIVVAPEYRRAPEHVFPAAHDDVLAACRWVRANAVRLGGDPDRLAIGGESVGATMAAATCVQLKGRGEALPAAQVLVCPLTTTEQYGESMIDAADARPLNRPLLSWMAMHAFDGIPGAARDARVDLLSLTAEQLTGLPPALVITGGRDVLRSQGERFAKNLSAAGVPTILSRYDGVMHEFFGAAAVLDKAEQAQREVADHLHAVFFRGPLVGAR